ncbi:ecotropic viral integration site 5 protein-like protein isoform X3 [Cucumis melo var. makuwa]|uniref:Ecotropic viral integration site 5 protein-like protein isoform X3 n=1 Tax=Cucumis melo var. makuwa TaxID=1194695 RepID=A0A5A7TRL4_CUCMM|nr:ecotropic viral integration site 5 protein-like protein isoform X3 [Cucumis melo var. makuwa]
MMIQRGYRGVRLAKPSITTVTFLLMNAVTPFISSIFAPRKFPEEGEREGETEETDLLAKIKFSFEDPPHSLRKFPNLADLLPPANGGEEHYAPHSRAEKLGVVTNDDRFSENLWVVELQVFLKYVVVLVEQALIGCRFQVGQYIGDAYGFALRPQHTHRYREYTNIYKEEEEERCYKWKNFLDQVATSFQACPLEEANTNTLQAETSKHKEEVRSRRSSTGDDSTGSDSEPVDTSDSSPTKLLESPIETQKRVVQTWCQIRPSLNAIEIMMSSRVEKKIMKDEKTINGGDHLPPPEEAESLDGTLANSEEDEACISGSLNRSTSATGAESRMGECMSNSVNPSKRDGDVAEGVSHDQLFTWKEELECLVRGGLPKDLRGEVWQAFVGVKTRRIEKYYQDLLDQETNCSADNENNIPSGVPIKLKKQIEKDIPRTFPGHPALDENGRDSLRRLLLAYALHNPSVGYCQAMNFFAGLLLLLMPEENAFWTLVGIIDDYFDGYYTEEMIESQVDQLVFEELMRERFPKLVKHLDYLGVQVAWFSGPWFLSIFVNMLPWESVLRVWDVLLFEGNRVMLFRTALALMELYGPALVTTKDAGDAITLLQSLAGSTFDSSQLVLTACMGFLTVTEVRLVELREKLRPSVLAVIEERTKKGRVWKDSKGLASKLYSFKHDPGSPVEMKKTAAGADAGPCTPNLDDFLSGLAGDSETESLPDLQEQVTIFPMGNWCHQIFVRQSEELETALMEMVTQDNRRLLSARVEQLEIEVAELKKTLAEKKEQEVAMLQLLMRVEQEQRVTEEARINAEQDVAAQKYAVHMLQDKYEKAMASLAEMEKRVVMAESMLEATLQYESGQVKATSSPRARNQGSGQENQRKIGLLPFALGWRDRNKGKSTEESSE